MAGLGLAIADVTGKGVPAALMMAYSRAVLRAGSMDGATPVEVLEKSNQLIMQERHSGLFVSAFYGEIELETGQLSYASAGHDAPLWIKAGGAAARRARSTGRGPGRLSGHWPRGAIRRPGSGRHPGVVHRWRDGGAR